MSIFEGYVSESLFDEVFDSEKNVRPYWKDILSEIEKAGLEVLKEKQADIDWHLEDNGVTFNVYNTHEKSAQRFWSMDPIPFVICEEEWSVLTKGLEQRAKLLNLIFKDLYGEKKLLKENIIPAEVVYGHKGYAPEVFDFGLKENFNLYFYATDMARGPDGKMWIINDRTQAPSGLGYAIENRLTMNSIAKDLYPNIQTKKLYTFVEEYKALLLKLADGDLSKAAILTPGPHNETYFEHAYLSSFLGIDLVQGEDLLSKNGSLWLKSLSGLKQINTLLRRVDDRYCDPLELNDASRLGVAGLVESMREDNLTLVNPIGSAILENVGFIPFMEKICEYFLNEKLLLPQIATWWCGQKKELDFVLQNLENLIIKKIDRTETIQVYFGKKLSVPEKEELKLLLVQNPHQYIAQEEVVFSTIPYFCTQKIEPRNAVVRTFCLKNDNGYSVMNGGLVRVSAQKDSLMVSSQKGGKSKDLWILGGAQDETSFANFFKYTQYLETSIDKISTPKAENLFWLGRYLARCITTTRLIMHVVKKITNFYRYEVATSKESQVILQNALTHMTMTYPGFLDVNNQKNLEIFPMHEIISVIKDVNRVGSLAFTITMLSNSNMNLKDLLAFESSKLFDKMLQEWNEFINRKHDSTLSVADNLDDLLIYLMAYKELVKESMFKEQGLIIYEIGYKIEVALLLISKARSMLCLKLDKFIGHDVLEGMLNSVESFNAYRAFYRSSLTLENVVDFLILNPQFPKSLVQITAQLLKEFKLLPKAKEYLTSYEKPIEKAQNLLEETQLLDLMQTQDNEGIHKKLDELLATLSGLYLECSNEFSNTYFSHYDE
jgi:uncharacterized circularly permuted ATP-grasp superfamily protein/uncharacterized alpha-E superfamily protein